MTIREEMDRLMECNAGHRVPASACRREGPSEWTGGVVAVICPFCSPLHGDPQMMPVAEDDPRGAPQPLTLAPPIVVEKHRHRMDGTEEVSFYACGPVRTGVTEAMADAHAFAELPLRHINEKDYKS